MNWVTYALISALAAALTALFTKIGVAGVPSGLATAIRTTVVLGLSWAMVLGLGEQRDLTSLPRRSLVFLVLSGIATGISWLAYLRALQHGPVARVAVIDKLSVPLTVMLAVVLLGEPLGWRAAAGVTLMTIGAFLTISA